MRVNPRDLAAGATFILIGLAFGINAALELRIGKAFSMGPGYFPILLSAILVLLGLAIAGSAVNKAAVPFGRVSWRGVGLVIAAIVFFGFTVRGLGMAPALGGATLMAAMAPTRSSLVKSIILSLCLTAFCVLVFVYALGLPYPVIGPWLAI